ncbi:MAG: enolase C-terminal domain-like protein [Burkholderiales bacterium]
MPKRNSPGTGHSPRRLTIERVEIIPLDLVPKNQRRIPTGPHLYGGKGSWVGRPVMVRIRAQGISGWGEVRPVNPFVGETAASMFACLRDFYGPLCIGRDALQIEDILRYCELKLPKNPGALAALDMALHDLAGKALNVPAHVLLGGACKDRIVMEWSLGLADEKAMIKEAEMAIENYGVKYLCVKVGPAAQIDADVSVVKKVRKALGAGVFLGVDANTTYDRVNAVKLVERLAAVDLTYFEQPVPAEALRDMRWIRDHANVAVLADESVYSASDAVNVIAAGAADVLGLKFYKCGGLRRSREIAVIAAASGHPVNCAGTANGSYIEAIAGAHLCAAIPNHAFGAEFMMGLPAVADDVLVRNQPIDIKDGYCNLPLLPGLGVDIDEAAVKRHQLARAVVDSK